MIRRLFRFSFSSLLSFIFFLFVVLASSWPAFRAFIFSPLSNRSGSIGEYQFHVQDSGYLGVIKNVDSNILLLGRLNIGTFLAYKLGEPDQSAYILSADKTPGHISFQYEASGFGLPDTSNFLVCDEMGFDSEVHICGVTVDGAVYILLDPYHLVYSFGLDISDLLEIRKRAKNN